LEAADYDGAALAPYLAERAEGLDVVIGDHPEG
jgi:hypothetical protein